MNLWSVEHFFDIFFIKIRFYVLPNALITVESNFDEKNNVKEMFNWSEVHSEKKYYS